MAVPGEGVRPTKRCLDEDLEVPVPDLGHRLEDVAHECVRAAQALPEQHEANACERIGALTDRVWFKVKTGDHRGAVVRLPMGTAAGQENHGHPDLGQWWLGAAGSRKADSSQDDFYAVLHARCERRKRQENEAGASHTASAVTHHLLPQDWDARRLTAETAEHVRRSMKRHVREMARQSMTSGDLICFELETHEVRVLVRANEGDTYLAVGTKGMSDERFFAMLLAAFTPMIDPGDWLPEPATPGLAIAPGHGEVIWSAILDAEQAGGLWEE